MKLSLNKIVKNKYLLYLLALISFMVILNNIFKEKFAAILFFYLICVITFNYTKNMNIVLLFALLSTLLVDLLNNKREGLANKKEKLTNKKEKLTNKKEKLTNKKEKLTNKKNENELLDELNKLTDEKIESIDELTNKKEKLTNKKENQKAGYQNQIKLNPGLYNIPNKDKLKTQDTEMDKIEKAYDGFDKLIGENGIRNMSAHTKDLVKQQGELLKSLKEITPALNEALGSIGKLDLSSLANVFKNIS